MSLTVPFDLSVALTQPDWRARAGWPVALADTHRRTRAGWQALWRVIADFGAQERDILLLAGARIVWQSLALMEAASVVQVAAKFGWTIDGGPAAVTFLLDAAEGDAPPAELAPSPFKIAPPIRFGGLRRLTRSLALSAPRAWLRLLTGPDAAALSHNSMMHAYARHNGCAVQFVHADEILRQARRLSTGAAPSADWTRDAAARLAQAMLEIGALEPVYQRRFMALARPFIEKQLDIALSDNHALKNVPSLPENIWYGGQLAARYIAVEARRRGAEVTGFEHGWGAACEEAYHLTAYAELAAVTRYVAMTPESARRLRRSAAHGVADPQRRIEFIPGEGDLDARRLPLDRARKAERPARPTVLYAPTILAGFRQFLPPLLPDTVHMDWQFRVCEALLGMPVNFICRPHPEGIFRGQLHPLNSLLRTSDLQFEELMAQTDVFIFDFQQSTTFGRALCSDRRIVAIDLGTPAFDAETEEELRRRCRVVTAVFDDMNRPWVDPEELREAVCGEAPTVDPSYFRRLMLGDGDGAR